MLFEEGVIQENVLNMPDNGVKFLIGVIDAKIKEANILSIAYVLSYSKVYFMFQLVTRKIIYVILTHCDCF